MKESCWTIFQCTNFTSGMRLWNLGNGIGGKLW